MYISNNIGHVENCRVRSTFFIEGSFILLFIKIEILKIFTLLFACPHSTFHPLEHLDEIRFQSNQGMRLLLLRYICLAAAQPLNSAKYFMRFLQCFTKDKVLPFRCCAAKPPFCRPARILDTLIALPVKALHDRAMRKI